MDKKTQISFQMKLQIGKKLILQQSIMSWALEISIKFNKLDKAILQKNSYKKS